MTIFRLLAAGLTLLSATTVCVAADNGVALELSPPSVEIEKQLTQIIGESATAPETWFQARRQARRVSGLVSEFLNSEAYLNATVKADVIEAPELRGVVRIELGPRFTISQIDLAINGADNLSRDDIRSQLPLEPDSLAIARQVVTAENVVVQLLREQGYALAKSSKRSVVGNAAAGTVDITLRVDAGPRILFGDVVFSDGLRSDRISLQRMVPFKPGTPFSPAALSSLNDRLNESRIYTSVTTLLSKDVSRVTPEGDEVRDVEVTAIERDRYTLTAGTSWSSSEGPGLNVSWTGRNLANYGDIFTLAGTLARQRRALDSTWRFPNVFGYGKTLDVKASAGEDITDAFDRRFASLGVSLDIQKSENTRFTFGLLSEFDSEIDTTEQRDLLINSVYGTLALDHTDDLLDPTQGWRAELRLELGVISGDISDRFLQSIGQLSAYRKLDESGKFVFAVRARAGALVGPEIESVPTSRRFFAGGGGSVRGYAYQGISPRDDIGNGIGGRGLLEFSTELRWRKSDKLGYVIFADAASVSSDDSPSVTDVRYGVGAGFRYYTPLGPLRFDVSVPLDRQPDEDRFQIYISIGQAF